MHTHPKGQTIYVTEGIGLAQRRGGPIEVIRPGDRVFFETGEDHWHGAAPNRYSRGCIDRSEHSSAAALQPTGSTRPAVVWLGEIVTPSR